MLSTTYTFHTTYVVGDRQLIHSCLSLESGNSSQAQEHWWLFPHAELHTEMLQDGTLAIVAANE